MENEVKLTKLAKCAGCGAKVGAGVLAQLLDGIKVHHDPNLLVGFDKSDDASVYKVTDDLALVQNFCDRVLVMYEGKIVEEGTPDEVIMQPKTEYTRTLVEAVL